MTPEERKRERARERRRARAAAKTAKPAEAEAVGYRQPPKHSRFKPGKSGNPSGRPKGKRSFNEMVERSAMMPVEVNVGGRRKRVPAIEAVYLRALNKALQGDLQSAKLVTALFHASGLGGPAAGSAEAFAQEMAEAAESLRRKLDAALEEDEATGLD